MKCNVDASSKQVNNLRGMRMILKDKYELFLKVIIAIIQDSRGPPLVEALYCGFALEWMRERQVRDIMVKSNNQILVQATKYSTYYVN